MPAMTRLSITPEDLRLHSAWLDSESQGVQLIRINANLKGANLEDANLEYANLKGANLKGANLKGANLEDANLEDANLWDANLRDANLRDANLKDANLWDANLKGANLKGANLKDASLWGANLKGANLWDANLRDASLWGANLWGANLRDANLKGASLWGANLRDADLSGAMGLPIAADAATRLQSIAEAALQPGALMMDAWHSCGTTHCIAGWAIHLAGEPGRIMESMMGPHLAGLLLLGAEAAEHFYDSDDEAMEYLQSVLSESR